MGSKNRPKDLVNDIMKDAIWQAEGYYPKNKGYLVTRHGNELWVDKKNVEVLTLFITRNAYQDQKYGVGKRVHNDAPKADGWRCTVCGNTKGK